MPLPAPNLDDRKFQDFVDEAKRLIPTYCPEWTNHNLSDPGVALIELFAWMSETVLFRLNQVPERLYVHFLNLVGIEPFPPSVARTELTFWLAAVRPNAITVPAGTQVATASGERESVVFTTTRDLVISPPELQAAATVPQGNEDRASDVWEDLRYPGSSVACFPSAELAQDDALYLGFAETLAGLVLRLSVEASAEGIGVDPRKPPLSWEVFTSEGWIRTRVLADTTGGLNRNGSIELLIPPAHEPLTVAGSRCYWLRVRLLDPVKGQPTYRASPQLGAVVALAVGGTVEAEHAATVGQESIGRSNGLPGQVFTVSRTPVLPRRSEETVRVVDLEGAVSWTEVADFTGSTPQDRHFVWDGGSGEVRFGPAVRYPDGSVRQHGAVPRDGAEILVTGYRYGGGVAGNVGANTLTVLRTGVPYLDRVSNLSPASGGVDAESVADAKVRGPMTLRTGQRAVTPGDFERLTLEASTEVARARCLPAAAPGGPVRVLVVPQIGRPTGERRLDDFALSDQLLSAISRHLDARRLVGTAVELATPYYQGVSVAVLARALPGRPSAPLRGRLTDLLTAYIDPLTGGPGGTGWPFDTDLNAASLAQLLEAAEGVERIDEVLLFEYDLRRARRVGSGRDLIRLERDSLFVSARHQVVVR